MPNLLTARVSIRGTRPVLWHHFGADAIPLEKVEKTGVAGNDPEEWRRTVLALPDGHLYFDSTYIFGCIRDGARYVKKGRGSIQEPLRATMQVVDDPICVDRSLPNGVDGDPPATDPTQPVYLDIRSVVNPSTKGRNVRYRIAASAGWLMNFRVQWDKTIVSRGELQSAVIEAGRLCGIGSGRRIGMGRFEVLDCDIADAP